MKCLKIINILFLFLIATFLNACSTNKNVVQLDTTEIAITNNIIVINQVENASSYNFYIMG